MDSSTPPYYVMPVGTEGQIREDLGKLSRREMRIIRDCVIYSKDPTGLPGHVLMMLVGKLMTWYVGRDDIEGMLAEVIDNMVDEPQKQDPRQGALFPK